MDGVHQTKVPSGTDGAGDTPVRGVEGVCSPARAHLASASLAAAKMAILFEIFPRSSNLKHTKRPTRPFHSRGVKF